MYEVYDNSFSCSSTLHQRQRNYTEEKPLPCKVNLAYNVQELSLTGGWVPYMKELTEQEEFTRKLFYLSNPTITNGGSDMGMNEDTQVSMSTSDGDGGELAAAFQIPGRADEEWMEVNTSQQYGMAAAVEDGEEYLEGSVDELNLNIVTCVKEEPCDDLAAVMEGGRLEPSRNEESAALGAEAPLASQARGQHHAYAASKENEDDLKPLERFHQEQVESTENYKATSNLLQQTLVEFKTDIRQNLQRDNEILQQHLQRNNEILERYLQNDNQILKQHLQRNNAILQQHLQRNKAILQQQNEFFCHILQ
ncbi:hypothetical protein scyTo_0002806 [Scyliorhinus torazame]|uniref:Uncharacterized protein n=2 Tax=Scyliorhinus torazame TaxID=75743 RepID=A0A401PKU1_SCYTO|nr:hypothetical protein [Scyliorhinus torazame]